MSLMPFTPVLLQFIALTAIDVFAYCAFGFMVYSPLALGASESFQLTLEKLLPQQATGRTPFQLPYAHIHIHISSLEGHRSHFRVDFILYSYVS
jgi:hypothetical protein